MRFFPGLKVCIVAGLVAALFTCGCGGENGIASPKQDQLELEQAFNLKAGSSPQEGSPEALAQKAVELIKAADWVKAVPLLDQLRSSKGLTGPQFQAVHNANGNAYARLVELAGKGNAEAKEVLARMKALRDRR